MRVLLCTGVVACHPFIRFVNSQRNLIKFIYFRKTNNDIEDLFTDNEILPVFALHIYKLLMFSEVCKLYAIGGKDLLFFNSKVAAT